MNSFVNFTCRRFSAKSKLVSDSLYKKIVYNCWLMEDDVRLKNYFVRSRLKFNAVKNEYLHQGDARPVGGGALCLKYLETGEPPTDSKPEHIDSHVHMPFNKVVSVISEELKEFTESADSDEGIWNPSSKKIVTKLIKDKNWIPHEPQIVNDAIFVDGEQVDTKYGTADARIPISNVPCGGCGALLHCQSTSLPGFVPKELFEGLNNQELRTLICQRCHFLKEYDIALGVDVSPDDYPRILASMRSKRALVLLMIDVLDMPCSIWPGIVDVIGPKIPIVAVANKIDLLPQDSTNFLNNVRNSVKDCLIDSGLPSKSIKHVALISAKTGFGVENLITQIHSSWGCQGDIYLVGCTNVGKSTLFNALIQSDLCKVQAVDILQRATVSHWPGTTLNLLKFPVLRPSHWRMAVRKARMFESEKIAMEALALRQEKLKKSNYMKQSSLNGEIGRTFLPACPLEGSSDPFSVAISSNPRGVTPLGISEKSQVYKETKWCFDTPGVVHPDQILNLLTTSEIMTALPKGLLIGRVVHLRPGYSILIGGLARVDLLLGPDLTWLTVFAPDELPLTVAKTEDMDEIYNELIGSDVLKVPSGGPDRMKLWPAMQSKTLQISGKIRQEAAADLVLSSAGWVAVTLDPAEICELRAWTPEARGIHIRLPLVKKAHKLRGGRIQGTPVFQNIQNHSVF